MSRAIVVDANVVIAAVAPSNSSHASSMTLLGEHADETKYLHRLTLAEIYAGPARQAGLEEVLRLEKILWRAGFEEVAPGDGPTALQMAAARAFGLRMPDAVVLATADRLGLPLATFDEQLAAKARARGIVVFGAGRLGSD